jgi:hypothetical protein
MLVFGALWIIVIALAAIPAAFRERQESDQEEEKLLESLHEPE